MTACFHGSAAVFAYLFPSMQVKKLYSFTIDFQKECACIKVTRLLMMLHIVSDILSSNFNKNVNT